eukprot:1196023-Prorocentrum_minimum.AAC.3
MHTLDAQHRLLAVWTAGLGVEHAGSVLVGLRAPVPRRPTLHFALAGVALLIRSSTTYSLAGLYSVSVYIRLSSKRVDVVLDYVQPGWTVLCLGLHQTGQYLAWLGRAVQQSFWWSRSITSFYGSSCANNGKGALNTPDA